MTAAELLEAMPDPAEVDEHWRRICREMVTRTAVREYERGFRAGHLATIADLKAFQHGEVRDAALERRRWVLLCPRCAQRGHRDGCPDCEYRARSTFGQPRPGDFPGREARAA
jgi:hypothetical protein